MSVIDLSSCRICSSTKKPLCPLFRYKHTGNYAEMLTGIADVKVASNDGLPDKICSKCCTCLEKAFLLKTIAERTDKELRRKLEHKKQTAPTKKIAFDSFTDIKSEVDQLAIKPEPKWEIEVDGFNADLGHSNDLNDIVIADTVIKKVEPNTDLNNVINNIFGDEKADVTWKAIKCAPSLDDAEYLDDDMFIGDDDDDEYIPPIKVKGKSKFKKPKLSDIKVYKEKKKSCLKKRLMRTEIVSEMNSSEDTSGQLITCYPIMKNGCRGPPILLKRPKDATVLKIHPNYKTRKATNRPKMSFREKTVRIVKKLEEDSHRQKEKMVCPVCGILTYTLGNHMNTHQDKKKYTCTQCPRSFAQRANLDVHMKQHSGIKDHICEVCGASFYCQKSLIRHNLIHKGERPFACNLCTKRFIARCDLNRHLRIHSGYKPFKCNTCTMSFNAKHQLQNHERMHTGERPYSCQVCNVAFSYKVNLNNHVLKVHDINLKFKSIHTVTEEVLQRENELMGNPTLPHLVPPPAAHETVAHFAM